MLDNHIYIILMMHISLQFSRGTTGMINVTLATNLLNMDLADIINLRLQSGYALNAFFLLMGRLYYCSVSGQVYGPSSQQPLAGEQLECYRDAARMEPGKCSPLASQGIRVK